MDLFRREGFTWKETKEVVVVTIASVTADILRMGGEQAPKIETLVVQLPLGPTHRADFAKLDELSQYHGMNNEMYRATPNKVDNM